MAQTFTRAIEVAKGDAITSRQLVSFARAINDRLRSGAGDGTYRILFYLHAIFRGIRDFTLEGDWWHHFQSIEPEIGFRYPGELPGGPGGINRANPMGALVFGTPGFDLESEPARLGKFPWASGSTISDEDAWMMAKLQRGSYDPDSGLLASPSFTAARGHFSIRYQNRSKFLNAWGGFHPLPDVLAGCEDPDPDDEFPPPINYEVKFTSLAGISPSTAGIHATVTDLGGGQKRLTYPGTCQPAPGDSYAEHVAGIAPLPWAYYVFLNNGIVDEIPTDQWIEGPYDGEAKLTKSPNTLQRILNAVIREFRGSKTQRKAAGYHVQQALDFERFLGSQYMLAPARGTKSGSNDVRAIYPKWEWSQSASGGSYGTCVQTRGPAYRVQSGFVIAAIFVKATKLEAATAIDILNAGKPVQRIEVLRAGEAEGMTKVFILSTPIAAPTLRVQLVERLGLKGGGKLEVEMAELVDYKPGIHDAWLFLRVAGASNADTHVDGRGIDEENARKIGTAYFDKGVLMNWHELGRLEERVDEISSCATYDAARRWSKMVRPIHWSQLRKYAVAGGKSILWFRRDHWSAEGTPSVDRFEGIGPSRTPVKSGELREGFSYVVTGDQVKYEGRVMRPGRPFTATSTTTFEGGGPVVEYNGIRAAAPPAGTTNEWLLDVYLAPYHPSSTSAWSAPAFPENFINFNRCHFGAPEISNVASTLWHISFGERILGTYGGPTSPESPSGYNYMPLPTSWLGRTTVNRIDCGDPEDPTCGEWKRNFYRSCRIYEPPAEIESAVMDGALLKVTLKGRLHSCPSAPSTISDDHTTWNSADLHAEEFRSLENGLREFILLQQAGEHCTAGDEPPYNFGGPSGQPGNAGANTSFYTFPDDPFGTCWPSIVLTQLIPEPYEDGNSGQDSRDTPLLHDPLNQAELYLRCMVEGYVDGGLSLRYACEKGVYTIFDYTWENACFEAFGGRQIAVLPHDVLGTYGDGYGPLPNTKTYADVYNQLVKVVNLLNRVRIMIPAQIESIIISGSKDFPTGAFSAGGDGSDCSEGSVRAVQVRYTPGDPGTTRTGLETWEVGLSGSTVAAQLNGTCTGTAWNVRVTRDNTYYRWGAIDPDSVYAIPENLRPLLTERPVVLAKMTSIKSRHRGEITGIIGDSEECCFDYQRPCPGFWHAGGSNWWVFPGTAVETYACVSATGVIAADALGSSHFAWGYTSSGAECPVGPTNQLTAELLSNSTAVVEIPLVDLP